MCMKKNKEKILVAHIVYRFDVGGLENGVVNLINHFPEDKYRHAIVCLTEYTDFFKRITKKDVEIYALYKKPGKDPLYYFRLWRVLRRIRPTITHTRNVGTIDAGVIAWLAGVKYRVHGEHGRDIYDVDGSNLRYQKLRRLCSPFIQTFIALAKDLQGWLVGDVRIKSGKVAQLYNGVDVDRFSIRSTLPERDLIPSEWQTLPDLVVFGTVGRMEAIKDQLNLVKAFDVLLKTHSDSKNNARLLLIGDGNMRSECEQYVENAELSELVWFTGKRDDIAQLLAQLDVFVLPSKAEGISNTILEAMSCSLPVIATSVGGNVELVEDNNTGYLVPAENPESLANAMSHYINNSELRIQHGISGRARVENNFSMIKMIESYMGIYDNLSR